MTLLNDIMTKRAIIIVGSGGVGKTTISSAIAIKSSEEGRKTLVMTVDPARRLADSLGIPTVSMTSEPIKIGDNLCAFMVDMRKSADKLVDKFSPSKDIAEKIKGHRFYKQATDFLMGSHEYVAGELLCDFYRKGDFEIIILDTPPARHALEFFEAPSKVMDFLKSKVISKFLKTYLMVGKTGVRIIKRFGGIFSIIEKLTGADLLLEISEFILFFEGMYEKFFIEAETLYSFLRSDDVSFYLVTSPERERISEIAAMRERLKELGIKKCGLIINKVNPFLFSHLTHETMQKEVPEKLIRIMNSMRERAEVQKRIIDGIMKKHKDIVIIPELPEEVLSIEKIREILPYLFT